MTGEARAALAQLHEVPSGDTIEEDHRRGTQLIVNYIRDKTGAIQPVERDGKVYLVVTDYAKMRQGVGMLLAELMRIKAEGDYDAAKALITKYGIHFDTAWRDQVVARYKTLDIPKYWVGINPDLELRRGAGGKMDVDDQLSARHGEAAAGVHEDQRGVAEILLRAESHRGKSRIGLFGRNRGAGEAVGEGFLFLGDRRGDVAAELREKFADGLIFREPIARVHAEEFVQACRAKSKGRRA